MGTRQVAVPDDKGGASPKQRRVLQSWEKEDLLRIDEVVDEERTPSATKGKKGAGNVPSR